MTLAPIASNRRNVVPADDLYLVLLITATVILLIGIVFLAVRSYQYFDSLWPVGGV